MPEPGKTKAQAADLRRALLDQLAYLIDEIEALKPLVDRVPVPVQEARPPGQPLSLKELYGLLATLDEVVHVTALRRMVAEAEPVFEDLDAEALAVAAGWNAQPIGTVLDRVQAARRNLMEALRALPPDAWARAGRFGAARRDVYGLAHHITQHDVARLRTIGYRLHESRLSERRVGRRS